MTDHTPEELIEYYRKLLDRVTDLLPHDRLLVFIDDEGRGWDDILAGPPPKPKWTKGEVSVNDHTSKVAIDYMAKDRGRTGQAHYQRIIIFDDEDYDLRDAIIDFLNKREEG